MFEQDRGKKKLGLGVVNLGRFTENFVIPSIRKIKQCALVSVFGGIEENLLRVGKKFCIPRLYNDYKQMLADDETNAIYITSLNVFQGKENTGGCVI